MAVELLKWPSQGNSNAHSPFLQGKMREEPWHKFETLGSSGGASSFGNCPFFAPRNTGWQAAGWRMEWTRAAEQAPATTGAVGAAFAFHFFCAC